MIQINLLPPELQRAARTPKALFFTLVGGVAAVMLFGFAIIWFRFSLSGLEEQVDHRRVSLNSMKEKAQEVDRINEDIAFYKERERAIIEIKSNRILWTQKLDQLVRRTPANVWITRLSLDTLDVSEYKWDKNNAQEGGSLELTCFAQGSDVAAITNYISALRGEQAFYKDLIDVRTLPDNFFGDFLSFARPSWQRVNLEEYDNADALKFVLQAQLKPLYANPATKNKKG